jgi:hypothetical protein
MSNVAAFEKWRSSRLADAYAMSTREFAGMLMPSTSCCSVVQRENAWMTASIRSTSLIAFHHGKGFGLDDMTHLGEGLQGQRRCDDRASFGVGLAVGAQHDVAAEHLVDRVIHHPPKS